MSTFIDRLETDLVRACDAPVATRRSWPAPLQSLSRRGRLRMLAVLTAVAAIATPAIAIGVAPILRDFFGQPVSTTADAPPAEQLALLGILRDPPPGASADPAMLGSSILPGIHGVRMNYIRLLPPAPGFPHQLLYTATSGDLGVGDPPAGADPAIEAKNLICVEEVEASGAGGDCTETSVLTSGHWLESAGLDGYGLVPDGVATVILRYSDHPAQTETVTDNTFSWQGYPAPAGPITGNAGQPSPGPTPEIPISITWLDSNGKVLSTHTNANAVS
ncbi:MAG TPA: hypothetical protein VK778_15345 [Solirubrobacteraceae bacterium]|jgi:hypothetical protein|nr:hypothetical protein [Solirubrobacteraceae bacterium]